MTTAEITQTIIQALGLLSLVFLGVTYYLDQRWKRAEAAHQFYDGYDSNKDCQLAMFMLDYQTSDAVIGFDYDFLPLSRVVHVRYSLSRRRDAMGKPYGELSDEEKVARFIFDVYIGYLERVFYLIKQGYFTERELIFYKYWLDKLVSPNCEDIRSYAVENSCGMFVPFLDHYKEKIQPRLDRITEF